MSMRTGLLAAFLWALAASAGVAQSAAEHAFRLGDIYPGTTFTPDREDIAIVDPAVPGNGLLLVLLTNIGAAPGAYHDLLAVAAAGGYHVLGLDWVNGFETDARGTNIFYQCGDNGDACFARAWQEAFDGSDRVPKVRIGPTDSVLNRLLKALTHLQAAYPGEGWDAFLAAGRPVWSRIAVAGHSNGAGEAAYIASRYPVSRVLLFSGPLDSIGEPPNLTPATWLAGPHATPSARWYAFAATRDASRTLDRAARYRVTWPALGLGASVVVDGLRPPFAGSHALVTAHAPCDGCTASNMTATDQTPHDAGGAPVFGPVWEYMLGIAPGAK